MNQFFTRPKLTREPKPRPLHLLAKPALEHTVLLQRDYATRKSVATGESQRTRLNEYWNMPHMIWLKRMSSQNLK